MRVLIAVTHLLGAGHLTRAAALARAFAAEGHAATLVSGGMPSKMIATEGVELVQLPPVRTTGTDFKALLGEDAAPVGEDRLAERRRRLVATLETVRPDVIITELFPFGRRVLAGEFLALVEAAWAMHPRPLVVSSIRDILVAPTRPGRIEETHERLLRLYDAVLVHGDPDLVPLDASWPVDGTLRPLLRYSGYVDEGEAVPTSGSRHGIVVSGGSSAAGLPLYRAALQAAGLVPDQPWRILVGNGVPEAEIEAFRSAAPPHTTVERARPDFRALLGQAALSVSQAGYNTIVDLLRTGVRSVLVPFEAGQETEQRLRAENLKARGLAAIVPEADLTAETLAEAVRDALDKGSPSRDIDLNGSRRSVTLVEDLVRSSPAHVAHFDGSQLDEALRRSRDAGQTVEFWWRDDDVVAATPELERLLDLSRRYDVPMALAAIPGRLEPSLPDRLSEEPLASVLVHGWIHANHASPRDKKAEFGDHRSVSEMSGDVAQALARATSLLGSKLLPVFVPPWNRIAPGFAPALPGLGYRGLSTFNDRRDLRAAPGLVQVNTHIDPIDWRGHRGLVDPRTLVSRIADAIGRRLSGGTGPQEPIGILSHHLVHTQEVWRFCDFLLERLSRNNVRFCEPLRVFSLPIGSS